MNWMPVAILLNSPPVQAVGEAASQATAHAAAGHGASSTGLMGMLIETNLINFFIALALILWLVNKLNVAGKMRDARERLKSEIETLERNKAATQADLQALKQRTSRLNEEVTDIINQAKISAEAMGKQILDTARLDADKILDASKKRIEMEQKSAARDLEKRLLADALQDARLELAQNLNAADQKRSVEAFLQEMEVK